MCALNAGYYYLSRMLFHTHIYNITQHKKENIITKLRMNPDAHAGCVHVRIRQRLQLKSTTVHYVGSVSDWDFYLSIMG